MITLYNMPLALNCYKVRLTLSLLKVPHQKHAIDLLKGEHQTPEFLKLNPFGQLPVVTEGDVVLRDSQAIMVWLARKFDDGRWLPREADDEAIVNSWLSAAAYEVRLGPYDARLAKLDPVRPMDYLELGEEVGIAAEAKPNCISFLRFTFNKESICFSSA